LSQKTTSNQLESRFQFVILAAKRARQLLKGARPKIKTKSRNPIRIAQQEIKMGLVDYELLESVPSKLDLEGEEQVIVVEEAGEELEGIPPLGSLEEEEEEMEEEEGEKLEDLHEIEEEEEEFESPEEESEEE